MLKSKADLYQIEVKESIGDVTSGLACSLAADIVIPPIFGSKKSANNVETVQDRQINVNKTRIENSGRSIDW
jgi:hypothetical protein